MHYLDRAAVPAPPCLNAFQHGLHNWDDVAGSQRQEIHAHLEQLQGRLCAYCEGSLDALGWHIEHFRTRNRFPQLTFDWSNLFWCCDRTDSCGHYKDAGAGAYNVSDLINPTVDNPDHFFRFNPNGTISIRNGLLPAQHQRAEETIRVLNLDAEFGRLRRMRQIAVSGYLALEPDILQALMDFSDEERREFVQEELAKTATQPFCTVIRHLFEELV